MACRKYIQWCNIHAPGGIRTHNPSRRAAVDLRLRPRGHWDRRHLSNAISRVVTRMNPCSRPTGFSLFLCLCLSELLYRLVTISFPPKTKLLIFKQTYHIYEMYNFDT